MAKLSDKLAESLEALKTLQEQQPNLVIKGTSTLGTTHTKRLVDNGFLQRVIKGWYIPSMPGSEGDTTVWYASYWAFIAAYANERFGTEWCLTPEQSLAFYSGNTIVPRQLVIRATKASNNVTQLMFDTSLLDISASLPSHIVTEPTFGLHLYPQIEALVFSSPAFFQSSALEARTVLSGIRDANDVLAVVADGGNSVRAGRIAGALRSIGRGEMADQIVSFMRRVGYNTQEENPFLDSYAIALPETSPYATRIRLMWEQMRRQILDLQHLIPASSDKQPLEGVLGRMDAQYVLDSYHSLSIEGYRVTEGLLERVRSGNWNPAKDASDADRRNALAARGYYQAYQLVRQSVAEIYEGSNAGEVFTRQHSDWHFQLFEPCVQAGIVKVSDLLGYRTHQVYIRGSRHTPLNPDAVSDAMHALCDLMQQEPNAFVRALLGHFFFVYIHPYMDGNGRTARFVMNVQLISGGYPWVVVPVDRREEYMQALEKASAEGDITSFLRFILTLL